MVATPTQKHRPLEVVTPLGPDALLLKGFTGREGLSQLFDFQLDLVAENNRKIPFEQLLGQPAGIRLALSNGKHRFFHGIVSRMSQGRQDQRYTHYRAQMVPQLWLLSKRVQSRIFQHRTVPQILAEVLQGLSVSCQIQGKFEPRDYCVQYRESDFAFASRLMEEEGIYYFFTHTKDKHQLVLANSPSSHPEVPELPEAIYDELEGGVRDEFRVHEWEKVQELRSGKTTLWDHCFELPGQNLQGQRSIGAPVQVGKVAHRQQLPSNQALEIYDYPGDYAGRFDGIDKGGAERPGELKKIFEDNQRTARIRMEQEALPGLVIHGASNCRQLVSGHQFNLQRHFDADGPYVLTTVEHFAQFDQQFDSGSSGDLDYRNRFRCVPLALPFRPPRVTPQPRVEGTQTAVVVGPKGEEIFTDKYSRVKVQFHWDRQGKNDADSSCWVRVATNWAGKQWGFIQIPRIGQEVIVDFLEGDPNQPIIIGSVYNAETMPPFKLPEKKMISGTKSNSYKGGGGYNELSFDDTKGKEKINVHAQFDMVTTVEHDDTQTVHRNREIKVDGTHTETITQATKITIEKGIYEHDVAKGTSTSHVKDKVTENYDATQDTTVQSNITITSTGGGIKVQAPGDAKTVPPAGEIMILAAKKITLVTGSSSLTMEDNGKITLAGVNVIVTGDADIQESAPKITLAGSEEVTMGVGPQSVTCDTAQVATSGSAIKATAVGVHEIVGAMVKIN
jgi:type VI secretion system secreted protein VgrG